MLYSPLIDKLIEALQCLPGVGPKSAQRMVFYLLERNPKGGFAIAQALQAALQQVERCHRCRNLSEQTLCHLCSNPKRDANILCVIETPADVIAIEQSGCYKGFYFVLGGHLSPIDGIGPKDLGIDILTSRLDEKTLQEVILATNPTVEGEATAHYIAELAKARNIKTSRIAYGVPMGGELEYIDSGTLARALLARDDYLF